jgi:hypothetical protein
MRLLRGIYFVSLLLFLVEVTLEEFLQFNNDFKPIRINVAQGRPREVAVEEAARAMMEDLKTAPFIR